jgi:hypothetical protein
MEILIFTLGVGLTYWMILSPCWKAQHARNVRDYQEVYHAYRLRMVRRFYPELRHLSFSELEDNFDIDQAFDRIGSFKPRIDN